MQKISRLDRTIGSCALFTKANRAVKLVPAIKAAGVLNPSKKPTHKDRAAGSNSLAAFNCVVDMEEALQCIEATCCDKAAVGHALINAEVAPKPSIVVVFDTELQKDTVDINDTEKSGAYVDHLAGVSFGMRISDFVLKYDWIRTSTSSLRCH
jgi:hypothetical protein